MRSFDELVRLSSNGGTAAMLYLLSWMAHSDGAICENEAATLSEIAKAGKQHQLLEEFVHLAALSRATDIESACEVLKGLRQQDRLGIMRLAVAVALVDGVLTIAEGHILRLLADVLALGLQGLNDAFESLTGAGFPSAADPSSLYWWQQREQSGGEKAGSQSANGAGQAPPPFGKAESVPNLQRLRDLAALGLDENASLTDIRAAYRRMAQVHHPDKFSPLGSEAVRAAEVSFRRIQSAYERLVSP
jgi:DnaJ like chaperone protein